MLVYYKCGVYTVYKNCTRNERISDQGLRSQGVVLRSQESQCALLSEADYGVHVMLDVMKLQAGKQRLNVRNV
jgi:hypothetical protein